VHVKTRELDVDHRYHALKLELRALHERLRLQTFDQFFAQRQQDRRVACGVFELSFRQFEIPVAETLGFIDVFVELTTGDSLEAVSFFDIAGADELTGEQCVEQSAEIDAEVVLDELRVELRVMRNLDRPRCFEQMAQWRKRIGVAVAEVIEVNDVNAVGCRELD